MPRELIAVFSEDLKASLNFEPIDGRYRAVLHEGDNGDDVIVVEQEINGAWHTTGGEWYVSTQTEDGIYDGISIDWGQKWSIASGMKDAINKALELKKSK